MGHQTLDAFIDPFHAFSLANSEEVLASDGHHLVTVEVEGLLVAQDTPRAIRANVLEPRESRALRLGASGRGTLGRDRLDQGCFDRRKALFKHRDGVPKIVSARCQRSGEQRICDI